MAHNFYILVLSHSVNVVYVSTKSLKPNKITCIVRMWMVLSNIMPLSGNVNYNEQNILDIFQIFCIYVLWWRICFLLNIYTGRYCRDATTVWHMHTNNPPKDKCGHVMIWLHVSILQSFTKNRLGSSPIFLTYLSHQMCLKIFSYLNHSKYT